MKIILKYSLYILFAFIMAYDVSYLNNILNYTFNLPLITVPFVEESFKCIALYYNTIYGIYYILIFSILEFVLYMKISLHEHGYVPTPYIIIRIIVIWFHLICFFIQYLGFNYYKKRGDIKILVLAFSVAVFLHFLWNLFIGTTLYILLLKVMT